MGPHIFQTCPSANYFDCRAMSIEARSQSARTYLERHMSGFTECNLNELVKHGLRALWETLPAEQDLTTKNVSIGIVGVYDLWWWWCISVPGRSWGKTTEKGTACSTCWWTCRKGWWTNGALSHKPVYMCIIKYVRMQEPLLMTVIYTLNQKMQRGLLVCFRNRSRCVFPK